MKAYLQTLATVGILCSCWVTCCSGVGDPVDSKLRTVYQRLHFEQLYPPEAVSLITAKLQGANKPVEILGQLAEDKQPAVRVLVATLLAELGDSEGGKILWRLLRDDEEMVRVAAGGGLIRLSRLTPVEIQVDALTDPRPEVQLFAAATLANLRDKSAEVGLITTLSSTNEMVRMEVAKALGACGTPERSVPALAKLLQDSSVLVRTWAAKSLGAFAGATPTTTLIKALDDTDWHVRAAAALALRGNMDETQRANITAALIPTLQDDKFALVRDRSADSLCYADDEQVVAALVRAVVSEQRDVRIHAARSIVNAKAVRALPLLQQHINDLNPAVRQKIIEIFGAIGGDDQVPAVTKAISDPDSEVQLAAIEAFHRLGSRVTPAGLLPKLADPNPHVRAATARALGDLGDRSVTPSLLPLLRDDSSFVRSAVAESLGKLGDRSAIKPLIQLLTGESTGGTNDSEGGLLIGHANESFLSDLEKKTVLERKIGAVKALGDIRAREAVNPIIEHGLKDDDAGVRAVSAYALGQIRDPIAVGPLEQSIRPFYMVAPGLHIDESDVIATGTNSVPDIVRQRQEKEIRVRASVVWALGQLSDPTSREILMKALDDNNSLVRDAAMEALQKINEQQERTALAAAAKSKTESIPAPVKPAP